jgi:hypothetical protein
MGRFDSDKNELGGGKYLTLKPGNQAIVRVKEIGASFQKQWPSGSSDKCKAFKLHVYATREDADCDWLEVDDEMSWTPTVKSIGEFIALCDLLDATEETVIHGRRLLLKRKDRASNNGFNFNWIQVHDMGDDEGFHSGVAKQARNDGDPDHAYPPPPKANTSDAKPSVQGLPAPKPKRLDCDAFLKLGSYESAHTAMSGAFAAAATDPDAKAALLVEWKKAKRVFLRTMIESATDANGVAGALQAALTKATGKGDEPLAAELQALADERTQIWTADVPF